MLRFNLYSLVGWLQCDHGRGGAHEVPEVLTGVQFHRLLSLKFIPMVLIHLLSLILLRLGCECHRSLWLTCLLECAAHCWNVLTHSQKTCQSSCAWCRIGDHLPSGETAAVFCLHTVDHQQYVCEKCQLFPINHFLQVVNEWLIK